MYKCEICQKEFEKYVSFSVHCNRKHDISHTELKSKYFPKLEKELKCNRCDFSFDDYEGLRKHSSRIHKIKSENFYVEFHLNGIHPACKCGCGEKVNFTGHGFKKYKVGHISRIKNNWGHNQTAIDKSSNTRRLQFKNGERTVWNDGLTKKTSDTVKLIGEMSKKENNPERAKKISLTQKQQFKDGIRNNSYINNPMYGKNHTTESKLIMRDKRMIWMKENDYTVKSKLEESFKKLLDGLNIQYEDQFYVKSIKAFYDFNIKNTKILVEADGDFWHCNPKTEFKVPKYECQIKNLEKDKIKNQWAVDNGYKLLRFWESDIKNNPAGVIKVLLNEVETINL